MKWTKQACINGLQEASVDGVVSSSAASGVAASLPAMARRRFGSFAAACRAAGLVCASESRPRFDVCTAPGCENKTRSVGCQYCEMHYGRQRRNGTLHNRKPEPTIEHTSGYLLAYAPDHPLAKGARAYEHRIVYYDAHGEGPFDCNWCGKRVGWEDMHVDHVNADRADNRLENLVASCPTCNQARGAEKMRRTKRARARKITHNGVTRTLDEWALHIGISRAALCTRLDRWSIGRALTEPRGKTGPRGSTPRPGGILASEPACC